LPSAEAAMAALGVPASAPPSLVPNLSLGGIDPEITLATEAVTLRGGNESIVLENGRVFFSTRPGPAILFEGEGPATSNQVLRASFGSWNPEGIEMTPSGLAGNLYEEATQIGGTDLPETRELRAHGQIRRMSDGESDALVSVSFHLLNFADYVGNGLITMAA
jgi:hypothetical protein